MALLLAACGSPPPAARPPGPVSAAPTVVPPATPGELPVTPPTPASPVPVTDAAPARAPAAEAPKPQVRRRVPLGAPAAARNWDEFRQQAARRLVQSNPDGTYLGTVPDPLLAIPVLEVELNADGSVRRVQVLRHPKQATDTTQTAIDAVQRAAPYGAMSRLPPPWKWVEVFLFDDNRRFKPRELDK